MPPKADGLDLRDVVPNPGGSSAHSSSCSSGRPEQRLRMARTRRAMTKALLRGT